MEEKVRTESKKGWIELLLIWNGGNYSMRHRYLQS